MILLLSLVMFDHLFSLAAGLAFLNTSCPLDKLPALQISIYLYMYKYEYTYIHIYISMFVYTCILYVCYNRFVLLGWPVDDRY